MELRHLRYFVAVAEHEHFGRAAAALHTAQPSLSTQIRQIEDEIGTPLFERTTRRVRLTPAGETFLEEARRVLQHLETGIERTREVATGMRGRLRFAYVSGAMHSVLPRILGDFADAYPHVAVHVETLSTEAQIAALREGRLDVGLFVTGLNPEGLATTHAWRERLILALPAAHALTRKRVVRYEDLEGQPLVMYARSAGSRMGDSIVSVLRRRNVNASIVFEGSEADTIVGLVAARRGLALVPAAWATFALDGVAFRPIAPTQFLPGLSLYWNPRTLDPLVRSFNDSAIKTIDAQTAAVLRRAAP